jgi:geranylgeranyl diphosphate synthase type II
LRCGCWRRAGLSWTRRCETGATLAGTDDGEVERLRRVGEEIGLAFQIRDDLLSYESSEEQMGKTLSSDERKQKSTYVRVLGLDGAREHLADSARALTAEIDALKLPRPGLIREFAAWASQRDS